MKWRDILIALGITLIIFLGMWFFFGSSGDALPGEETPTATSSPFGSGDGVSTASSKDFEGQVAPVGVGEGEKVENALFKIAAAPVAGFVTLARASSTVIRYADRATGHIFEAVLPGTGTGNMTKKRLTNNTLPQIYEAIFRADGNAVLMRSLDEGSDVVENVSLTLTPPAASSTEALWSVSATSMRGNLDGLAAGTGNLLTYVIKETGAIISSTFQGDGVKTLWNSSFRSWRTQRFGTNTLVFTKPSNAVPGYAYMLTGAGGLTKLFGPLNGLSVMGNSAGTRILYSYAAGPLQLATYDLTKKTSEEISPATLAEKCVWSSKNTAAFFCGTPTNGLSGNQPDDWYAGKTHFSDYIWQFDANTQISNLIVEPKGDFGVELDVFRPALSVDESYIVFINKTDLSLWAAYLLR